MDRYLLSGALGLLIIEVFFLLVELGLVPSHLISFDKSQSSRPTIGFVASTKQNVRHKQSNSIMWFTSQASDTLHVHDSVLTLKNSAAKLDLQNDVQLVLDENTLVVLEPTDKGDDGEIRLRFSRGVLQSKLAGSAMTLQTKDVVIQAGANSQIALRSSGEDKLQLEVTKGQVTIKNDNIETFGEGQRITLDQDKVKDVKKISDTLAWANPENQRRYYTHESFLSVPLKWSGQASTLKVLKADVEEKSISLEPNQRTLAVELPLGSYGLSLEHNGQVSRFLNVQIWPAPKIRYFSPLPRDRIETNKAALFSWSPISAASSYRVEFSRSPLFSNVAFEAPAPSSIQEVAVEPKGDLYWQVIGVDELGYEIPAFYSLPLYSEPDPLAPPTLMNPLRAPASPDKAEDTPETSQLDQPGKKWLRELWSEVALWLDPWPEAEGQSKTEIPKSQKLIFSWYPVPEADHYVIEICSDPKFESPEVIESVGTESFVWKGFSKKTYYWRVAAGQKGGRRGLFSQAAQVDLTKLGSLSMGELAPGVKLVEEKPAVKTKPKPVPKKVEANKPAPPKPQHAAPKPKPEGKRKLQAWLSSDYHFYNFSLSNDLDASFAGAPNLSLGVSYWMPLGLRGQLEAHAQHFQVGWVPKSKTTWPFQGDLTDSQTHLRLLYSKVGDEFAFGISVDQVSPLERADLEELDYELQSAMVYGAGGQYNFVLAKGLISRHFIGINYGGGYWVPTSYNSVLYDLRDFKSSKVFIGGRFDIKFLFGNNDQSGSYGMAGALIGLEW